MFKDYISSAPNELRVEPVPVFFFFFFFFNVGEVWESVSLVHLASLGTSRHPYLWDPSGLEDLPVEFLKCFACF